MAEEDVSKAAPKTESTKVRDAGATPVTEWIENGTRHVKTVNDRFCESRYKFGRVLGQGSFACVKMATDREDGSEWAIKIIRMSCLDLDDDQAIKAEIGILSRVEHINIVGTREIYESPRFCMIVMEICRGGELFDRIVEKDHYCESEAKQCFRDLISAISYIHSQDIVHRDLKPENLLYATIDDKSVLKLADFGLSKIMKPNEMLKNACGTPGYLAPEMLESKPYGKPVDLWGCGIILYILICGFPPFYADDEQDLFRDIKSGDFEFTEPYFDDASPEVIDLIKKLLELDVDKRLTAQQAMEHEWMAAEFNTSSDHKPGMIKQMRKFNARRRVKGAVRAIMSANILKRAFMFKKKIVEAVEHSELPTIEVERPTKVVEMPRIVELKAAERTVLIPQINDVKQVPTLERSNISPGSVEVSKGEATTTTTTTDDDSLNLPKLSS